MRRSGRDLCDERDLAVVPPLARDAGDGGPRAVGDHGKPCADDLAARDGHLDRIRTALRACHFASIADCKVRARERSNP